MDGEEAEGDELGGSASEFKQLQAELQEETKSRQRQEQLNSKLQDEYDILLKKLAEAELHIDQLRLRANVNINKRFILSHHSSQCSSLQQDLLGSRAHSTTSSSGCAGGPMQSVSGEASASGHHLTSTPAGGRVQTRDDTGHNLSLSYSYGSDTSRFASLSPHQGSQFSPLPRDEELSPSPQQGGSGLDVSHSRNEGPIRQVVSETPSDASQLSEGYVSTQASAESQHLAQLLRIRSLQEQISSLKNKLKSDQASFDELSEDLGAILENHAELTRNVAASSEQLEGMKVQYRDKAAKDIAQRKQVLENELWGLADQLKDLDALLRSKAHTSAFDQQSPSPPPPNSSLCPRGSSHTHSEEEEEEGGNVGEKRSPNLPARYLDSGPQHDSTTTDYLESHSQTSELGILDSSSQYSVLAPDRDKESLGEGESSDNLERNSKLKASRRRGGGASVPTVADKKPTLRKSRIPRRVGSTSPPKLVPLLRRQSDHTLTGGGAWRPTAAAGVEQPLRKKSSPAILEFQEILNDRQGVTFAKDTTPPRPVLPRVSSGALGAGPFTAAKSVSATKTSKPPPVYETSPTKTSPTSLVRDDPPATSPTSLVYDVPPLKTSPSARQGVKWGEGMSRRGGDPGAEEGMGGRGGSPHKLGAEEGVRWGEDVAKRRGGDSRQHGGEEGVEWGEEAMLRRGGTDPHQLGAKEGVTRRGGRDPHQLGAEEGVTRRGEGAEEGVTRRGDNPHQLGDEVGVAWGQGATGRSDTDQRFSPTAEGGVKWGEGVARRGGDVGGVKWREDITGRGGEADRKLRPAAGEAADEGTLMWREEGRVSEPRQLAVGEGVTGRGSDLCQWTADEGVVWGQRPSLRVEGSGGLRVEESGGRRPSLTAEEGAGAKWEGVRRRGSYADQNLRPAAAEGVKWVEEEGAARRVDYTSSQSDSHQRLSSVADEGGMAVGGADMEAARRKESSTSGSGESSEEKRKSSKLTLATMDALKKELMALRDQLVNSSLLPQSPPPTSVSASTFHVASVPPQSPRTSLSASVFPRTSVSASVLQPASASVLQPAAFQQAPTTVLAPDSASVLQPASVPLPVHSNSSASPTVLQLAPFQQAPTLQAASASVLQPALVLQPAPASSVYPTSSVSPTVLQPAAPPLSASGPASVSVLPGAVSVLPSTTLDQAGSTGYPPYYHTVGGRSTSLGSALPPTPTIIPSPLPTPDHASQLPDRPTSSPAPPTPDHTFLAGSHAGSAEWGAGPLSSLPPSSVMLDPPTLTTPHLSDPEQEPVTTPVTTPLTTPTHDIVPEPKPTPARVCGMERGTGMESAPTNLSSGIESIDAGGRESVLRRTKPDHADGTRNVAVNTDIMELGSPLGILSPGFDIASGRKTVTEATPTGEGERKWKVGHGHSTIGRHDKAIATSGLGQVTPSSSGLSISPHTPLSSPPASPTPSPPRPSPHPSNTSSSLYTPPSQPGSALLLPDHTHSHSLHPVDTSTTDELTTPPSYPISSEATLLTPCKSTSEQASSSSPLGFSFTESQLDSGQPHDLSLSTFGYHSDSPTHVEEGRGSLGHTPLTGESKVGGDSVGDHMMKLGKSRNKDRETWATSRDQATSTNSANLAPDTPTIRVKGYKPHKARHSSSVDVGVGGWGLKGRDVGVQVESSAAAVDKSTSPLKVKEDSVGPTTHRYRSSEPSTNYRISRPVTRRFTSHTPSSTYSCSRHHGSHASAPTHSHVDNVTTSYYVRRLTSPATSPTKTVATRSHAPYGRSQAADYEETDEDINEPLISSTPRHTHSRTLSMSPTKYSHVPSSRTRTFHTTTPPISPTHAHLFSAPPPPSPNMYEDGHRKVFVYKEDRGRTHSREGRGHARAYGSSPEEDKYGGRSSRHYSSGYHHHRPSQTSDSPSVRSHDYRGVSASGSGYGERDPVLVVNIHKDQDSSEHHYRRSNSRTGGQRHVDVTSSDSDKERERGHIQATESSGSGSGVDLKAAVRLARQLRRRSEKMRGTLQTELARQGLL